MKTSSKENMNKVPIQTLNKCLKHIILFLIVISFMQETSAQDAVEEIDASKPTNFYSSLDNSLEYSNANVYGYRGNLTFALSESHLLLAEVPLLYNEKTEYFGIGDLRARYFFLPYKNYDKLFGAFGPSLDVFVPTGNVDKGIGTGSWVISPGITIGLVADWIQVFPIISYQYVSKSSTKLIPEDQKKEAHGLSMQAIVPIIISDKFFISVTPVYRLNNFSDTKQDRFVQQFAAVYALAEKMQLSAYFSNNSKDEIFVYRLGLTVFL